LAFAVNVNVKEILVQSKLKQKALIFFSSEIDSVFASQH
jgi:hypothetical protein